MTSFYVIMILGDNMKKKILIISIVIIILMLILSFFHLKKDINNLDVFFFKNDDEKYYLFDTAGNRLTNDTYDKVLDYIVASTLVYKDDEVSIIDKHGKVLKDEDDYSEILRYASFYKATKGDKTYLLDNNGDVIKDITDDEVISFKGANKYLIIDSKDTYEIVLYNGKSIYKFAKKDDILPTVNQLDNLSSVFYDDKTIIFDSDTGKVINTIEDNIHYCINSKNNDVIVLNTCSNTYQEKLRYKVIIDDKVKNIDSNCSLISLSGNNILCENNNKKYLLDEDLKNRLDVSGMINYIDYDNYIKEDNNRVEFFKNGKSVKTIDNVTLMNLGYQSDDYYILKADDYYYYYDISGKLMFDGKYNDANIFDNNSLALVSNGTLEFLIDKKGNRVTEEVTSIISYSDFYIISNERSGLLDSRGKKILDMEYDSIDLLDDNNHNYALLKRGQESIIYDIDNKKIIGTYDNIETFTNYYRAGNKYYTYNGKLIYESNKK